MNCLPQPQDVHRRRRQLQRIQLPSTAPAEKLAPLRWDGPKTNKTKVPAPPSPANSIVDDTIASSLQVASAYRQVPTSPDIYKRFACGVGKPQQHSEQLPPGVPTAPPPVDKNAEGNLWSAARKERYERYRAKSRSRTPRSGSSPRTTSVTSEKSSSSSIVEIRGQGSLLNKSSRPSPMRFFCSPSNSSFSKQTTPRSQNFDEVASPQTTLSQNQQRSSCTPPLEDSPDQSHNQQAFDSSKSRSDKSKKGQLKISTTELTPDAPSFCTPTGSGTLDEPIVVEDMSWDDETGYEGSREDLNRVVPGSSNSSDSNTRRDRVEEVRDAVEQARSGLVDDREDQEQEKTVTTTDSRGMASRPTKGGLYMPSLRSMNSRELESRASDGGSSASSSREFYRESFRKNIQSKANGVSANRKYSKARDNLRTAKAKLSDTFKTLHLDPNTPPLDENSAASVDANSREQTRLPSASGDAQLDQRTVRMLYSKDFSHIINDHQSNSIGCSSEGGEERPFRRIKYGVSFVARKRPILDVELEEGDFDVIGEAQTMNSLLVYQTRILGDRKTKRVTPIQFLFDEAFVGEHTSTDFYEGIGRPYVKDAVLGGRSTVVIYGTPGSGKTRTMEDIENGVALDLFHFSKSGRSRDKLIAWVNYLEVRDNQCIDLLGPVGNFVRITTGESGSYELRGAAKKVATNHHELLRTFASVNRRLETQASIRKKQPGYLLCQITVRYNGHQGSIKILKCPSTETGFSGDLSSHSDFDSLMNSFRTKASGKIFKNPFVRKSVLTKILQEDLENKQSKVCVITTLCPLATSTESTISVLDGAQRLQEGIQTDPSSPSSDSLQSDDGQLLPRQWTNADLVAWMAKKNLLENPVAEDVNGRFAMRMTKLQLQNTFYKIGEKSKAEKLFVALRAANDRVARLRVKKKMAEEKRRAVE